MPAEAGGDAGVTARAVDRLLTLPEDANIYASKYQLYLPSKEELADQVARVRREIGGRE